MVNNLSPSNEYYSLKSIKILFYVTILLQMVAKIYSNESNENPASYINKEDRVYEDKLFLKLNKTIHENEAINSLNECIYRNMKFKDTRILNLVSGKRWIRATRLLIDFLLDLEDKKNEDNLKQEINSLLNNTLSHFQYFKNALYLKKKNIIRISPIFEWSQDSEFIKIRLKFAKNLESPGEKDIQNFRMNCSRTHLTVRGYKIKDDYLTYYYRNIHLYDFIKFMTCEGYKETDGTYIIKFMKNQPTLYWNFLDQIGDDHHNTYTWFDVFTAYDSKARYTSFREWAMENLYMSDVSDYVKDKVEEKTRRLNKIKNILNYLKTKDFQNKNFCNSPINENYCILADIHDWNYWLF